MNFVYPMTFLEAVARQEGFYTKGTRPERCKNPGDIEFGRFAKAHGALRGDPRFAVFPDEETGFAAMRALFRGAYRGMTIAQSLNKWAPPVENQTNAYIANVCKWTGLTPQHIVDTIL